MIGLQRCSGCSGLYDFNIVIVTMTDSPPLLHPSRSLTVAALLLAPSREYLGLPFTGGVSSNFPTKKHNLTSFPPLVYTFTSLYTKNVQPT